MYDYVIVGAGSAGCALAARLTEDPNATVLLLEAGGEGRRREVGVPAAFPALFRTEVDWAYETEPQPRLNRRRLYWPRGKMLGGSGSMNAMIYVRGNRRDFDAWAEAGNEGWDFASVLPFFKKAERNSRGASEFHGGDGPLCVSDPRSPSPLSRAFVEAAVSRGFPPNDDFNGPEQAGVGLYQVTQRRGRRHGPAAAYLAPARSRPNLTVETGAHATAVVFEGRRAVGVRYARGGAERVARAAREVVLCGGAVNSPQLLMLSGVGPADHLRSLGIAVVADLPGVGYNLQDHLLVPVAFSCVRPVSLATAGGPLDVLRYLLGRTGPLTSNIAEAGGFVKTAPGLPAPNLQLHFGPLFYLDHGFTRPSGHGFTVAPTLVAPQSRGYVALRSADPFAPPVVEPNYLAAAEDLHTLVEGVEIAREIVRARPFDPYRGAEVCPGLGAHGRRALVDHVRASAETIYHPAGTCRMGSDPMAVVDDWLRVHGVEGLRVVDASVMPALVTGNPNAAVVMVAERAAAMMRHNRKTGGLARAAERPRLARAVAGSLRSLLPL